MQKPCREHLNKHQRNRFNPVEQALKCSARLFLLFRLSLGLLLQHFFDNLLFLNKERPHNAVLDAFGASRSSVRALHLLLGFGDSRVLARSKSRHL